MKVIVQLDSSIESNEVVDLVFTRFPHAQIQLGLGDYLPISIEPPVRRALPEPEPTPVIERVNKPPLAVIEPRNAENDLEFVDDIPGLLRVKRDGMGAARATVKEGDQSLVQVTALILRARARAGQVVTPKGVNDELIRYTRFSGNRASEALHQLAGFELVRPITGSGKKVYQYEILAELFEDNALDVLGVKPEWVPRSAPAVERPVIPPAREKHKVGIKRDKLRAGGSVREQVIAFGLRNANLFTVEDVVSIMDAAGGVKENIRANAHSLISKIVAAGLAIKLAQSVYQLTDTCLDRYKHMRPRIVDHPLGGVKVGAGQEPVEAAVQNGDQNND